MKQQALIGMDIGTTSTKAVAFDMEGKMLFREAIEYPIISTQPDYAEQDPEVVLKAVLDTLSTVALELKILGVELMGVSFSSAMHSLIAVDAQGDPLTKCIIWADTRSKVYATNLKGSVIGHDIYLHTGTPLHPMSPLPKLRWLRDHEPLLFKNTVKFIGIKEYVFFRLFGEYKIDYSIASATGLFNIFKFDWHLDSLELAGITKDKLSEPVPPTHTFRNMKPDYATLLNIPATVPFVIGASDGCLANLGSNAVRPGDAVVTIGTSGAVRVMANEPATDIQERIFSYILTSKRFVLGGAVNNGGVVLRWFRDNFYASETALAAQENEDIYELMNKRAAAVPPGADGLIFLPYLLGERAPIWDPAARACFFGVHYNHTREHFLRALMEGVMFNVYSVGRALEQTTGPIAAIYANGGFSRSDLWVQMLADIFNKEVHLTDTHEGSAFGAVIMGMYALGLITNLEDAAAMIRVKKTFVPDPKLHSRYMQNFSLFNELYPKLKDCLHKASHHIGA
ncbi:gluconate kinase [Pontibacter diazotrophicus]|uniref:Gluconate kinase n=1 Tax=Pontibacter diazotrophicus TaxID=1400979 RepID=A0A3D8LGL5_9BACT|nr:gluconokinase [Pontibacter diazotrophicus]RDV16052.1 gluconate kinase [Pontibacter diazotrophicus]